MADYRVATPRYAQAMNNFDPSTGVIYINANEMAWTGGLVERAAVSGRITTITTLSAARAAAEGIAALQRGEVRVQALQALHAERVAAK